MGLEKFGCSLEDWLVDLKVDKRIGLCNEVGGWGGVKIIMVTKLRSKVVVSHWTLPIVFLISCMLTFRTKMSLSLTAVMNFPRYIVVLREIMTITLKID